MILLPLEAGIDTLMIDYRQVICYHDVVDALLGLNMISRALMIRRAISLFVSAATLALRLLLPCLSCHAIRFAIAAIAVAVTPLRQQILSRLSSSVFTPSNIPLADSSSLRYRGLTQGEGAWCCGGAGIAVVNVVSLLNFYKKRYWQKIPKPAAHQIGAGVTRPGRWCGRGEGAPMSAFIATRWHLPKAQCGLRHYVPGRCQTTIFPQWRGTGGARGCRE